MEAERLLSQTFLEAHPEDAAVTLERLPVSTWAAVLPEFPAPAVARAFSRMVPSVAADGLALMPIEFAAEVLGELRMDSAAGFLRRMDEADRDRLFEALSASIAEPLKRLLNFPEHTAGGLMDTRILSVPDDIQVGEALRRVRRLSRLALYYLYVVDRNQILVGVLTLRELMLASTKELIAAIMQTRVVRLSAFADRRDIAAHPGWRSYTTLPVVDPGGRLMGVIRYETVRELEEAAAVRRHPQAALSIPMTLARLYWETVMILSHGLTARVLPHEGEAGSSGSMRDGR